MSESERWKVWPTHWAGGSSAVQVNGQNAVWVESYGGLQVCAMIHHGINGYAPTNEDYARAYLIAAAPDLLAACKTAYDAIASLPIDAMGSGHNGQLVWPIRDEVLDQIAKAIAIAKARGEVRGE